MGGPFPPLLVPTFLSGPRLAWGTFSLPPQHLMTRTDFLDLMLSFGRIKLPPSSPILYHSLLLPTPALLHKNSQVPPPFSASWASKKCFLPIFFNALLLTRSIGWLHTLLSLSHTSVLSILPSFKIHKSLIPLIQKFATRFSQDNLRLLPLTLIALLPPPPSTTSEQPWILTLKPANLPLPLYHQTMTTFSKLLPLN